MIDGALKYFESISIFTLFFKISAIADYVIEAMGSHPVLST